jgi:hypothetical protein
MMRYGHCFSMLGGRIGGDQPWRRDLEGVVPRDECLRTAVTDCQANLNSAGNTVRRPLANFFDGSSGRRFCDCPPDTLPVSGIDVEYTCPFATVSLGSKDPLQLALLKPDACGTGERSAGTRGPRHGFDARGRDFMRVQRRSILRVINRTKDARR